MRDRADGVVLLANGHVVYWSEPNGVDLDLATGTEHMLPKVPAALLHGYPFAPGTVAGSLVISPLAQLSWNATTGVYKSLANLSAGSTSLGGGGECGSAAAWTGHVLLTWGGSECQGDSYLDSGAEYDPSSGALRPLPKFLSGRTGMASAWTGTELLVWGGQTDLNGHVIGDGASLSYAPPSGCGSSGFSPPNWPQSATLISVLAADAPEVARRFVATELGIADVAAVGELDVSESGCTVHLRVGNLRGVVVFIETSPQRYTVEGFNLGEISGASVQVMGRRVDMVYDRECACASWEMHIRYGDAVTSVGPTPSSHMTAALSKEPRVSGGYVLVDRLADGSIRSAHAATIPAGDFAAS
jgi:hypothetical protein